MKTVIKNIGTIVSGELERPLLEGDTIVVEGTTIAQVGSSAACNVRDADRVIDVKGTTVMPGLIDSHSHPVIGDYTPRQRMVDFIDSCLHGGVTTMMSAGEVHFPGRPKDVIGVKATAIAVHRSFENFRPGGVKVRAGAPILELGLTERDFAEMAQAGVRLIGEIGLGTARDPEMAAEMARWGRKHQMRSTTHTGGPSSPGSNYMPASAVLVIQPDIAGHINGGTTSIAPREIETIVAESAMALEVVHCGNPKTALHTLAVARARNQLHRVLIGTDMPTGSGVMPLAMLRMLALFASLGDLPPEQAVAMATGNIARVHGLNTGRILVGADADLVVLDAPLNSISPEAMGSLKAGDIPGVSVVLIDGEVRVNKSRNTPAAARMAEIEGLPVPVSPR
jgi:enamidase